MMPNSEKPYVLELHTITKSFDSTPVLHGIDLAVREGEFVTLLGPSGCGKTTILRIIAGLTAPDGGRVLLAGEDVAAIPPEGRNVNMVFQNYALFPHMNVAQNIAYGLKIRRIAKAEIQRRVANALALVRMEGFEKRMPSEMSGGQRQRIAIARAIVNSPRVLLLDEPLGALDLQLRRQMQRELKQLQQELGITFIYITHDQEEAINMSDRIAVLREGRIEQIGTPAEVYDHPRTGFVARFVGAANVLRGSVESCGGKMAVLRCVAGTMPVCVEGETVTVGQEVYIAVRGENIRIWREAKSEQFLRVVIREKSFAGGMLRIAAQTEDGTEIIIRRHGVNFDYDAGECVFLEWDAASAVLLAEGDI